jgi:polyisoprenoid-binding protein YceI
MSRLAKILIGLGIAVVVLVGAAVAAWFLFIKSDPEPRAAIEETPVVTDPEGQAPDSSELDGTYTVAPGDADNFVGYRVTEQFVAGLVDNVATGRTSDVTGSFTIRGTTVEEVDVTANLLTLKSDRDRRDNRIKTLGLESETFPEAKFVLTEPIDFGEVPQAGETVRADAVGDFTLHGVTKRVTIPLEGRWDGRDIQVVGNLPVVFADYDMETPNVAGFVSVRDEGEMELQLFFRKG